MENLNEPTYRNLLKYVFFINIKANEVENYEWKVFVKIALRNCRGGRGQIKLCWAPKTNVFEGNHIQNGVDIIGLFLPSKISKVLQKEEFVPSWKKIGKRWQNAEWVDL